jgi:hypothetical protein
MFYSPHLPMSFLKQWIWPDVSLLRQAQAAIDEAFWLTLILTGFRFYTLCMSYMTAPENGLNVRFLLKTICFGVLALGIHYRSRIAATLAFSWYAAGFVFSLIFLHPGTAIIFAAIALALFAGVRGALAYHKFPRKSENVPFVADSFKSLKSPSDLSDSTPS